MRNSILLLIALGFVLIINRAYAQDSLVISLDTITVKKYGQTFKNGVILDFVYQFIYPTNDTPAIKRIKEQMIQDFFDIESPMPLEQAQRHFEKDIFHKEYASQQLCDSLGRHQYFNVYSKIIINHNKVLVLCTQSYCDWGGLHGIEPKQYTCYDIQAGTKITLQDLFCNPNQDIILDMIKGKLTKEHQQKNAFLTDNFMLLPQGIRFVYNPYQIASYAEGYITVTLPLSKIRHLLKSSALTYFEE